MHATQQRQSRPTSQGNVTTGATQYNAPTSENMLPWMRQAAQSIHTHAHCERCASSNRRQTPRPKCTVYDIIKRALGGYREAARERATPVEWHKTEQAASLQLTAPLDRSDDDHLHLPHPRRDRGRRVAKAGASYEAAAPGSQPHLPHQLRGCVRSRHGRGEHGGHGEVALSSSPHPACRHRAVAPASGATASTAPVLGEGLGDGQGWKVGSHLPGLWQQIGELSRQTCPGRPRLAAPADHGWFPTQRVRVGEGSCRGRWSSDAAGVVEAATPHARAHGRRWMVPEPACWLRIQAAQTGARRCPRGPVSWLWPSPARRWSPRGASSRRRARPRSVWQCWWWVSVVAAVLVA